MDAPVQNVGCIAYVDLPGGIKIRLEGMWHCSMPMYKVVVASPDPPVLPIILKGVVVNNNDWKRACDEAIEAVLKDWPS